MTEREVLIRAVVARAANRGVGVYGYDSHDCRTMRLTYNAKKGVPECWDRICAEGDPEWTKLPRLDAVDGGESNPA